MVMCAAATAATAAYASAGISKGISLLSVKLVFEIGRPQAKATRSRANAMLTCNSAQTRVLASSSPSQNHRALNISTRQALNNCASAD